jgi:dTDP-4-dehydrorhamnose reductase
LKILLLGKNGQLGRAFQKQFQRAPLQVFAFSKAELDVTDASAVELQMIRIRPDVTINCTAYTDVNAAEQNPEPALALNCKAINTLSEYCAKIQSKLIHFSTDYVFDGLKKQPYNESDATNPLNEYGRSKLLGEKVLKTTKAPWLLFRSSWIYGEGLNNFIAKLEHWANGSDKLRIVDDEISVPTSAADLALFVYRCIQADLTGCYHLVNVGTASRYEFAVAIKKFLPEIKSSIIPAKLIEFNSGPIRPAYSVLDNSRVVECLGCTPPHWIDALERHVRSKGK